MQCTDQDLALCPSDKTPGPALSQAGRFPVRLGPAAAPAPHSGPLGLSYMSQQCLASTHPGSLSPGRSPVLTAKSRAVSIRGRMQVAWQTQGVNHISLAIARGDGNRPLRFWCHQLPSYPRTAFPKLESVPGPTSPHILQDQNCTSH